MVYEPSARYEQPILEGVVTFLENRYGEKLGDRRRPDTELRDVEAVDLLASGASRRFTIEHTRLNSFSGQIADDAQLNKRLWPVLSRLDKVRGRFELAIRAGDIAKMPKHRASAAIDDIVEWVIREAPQLDAEREFEEAGRDGIFSTMKPPSPLVPFELRLTRETQHGSQVYIARTLPPQIEQEREADVRRALREKNPKLAAWATDDRTRVLVLETRDVQSQSFGLVARAVEAAARQHHDMPELVLLVETDGRPWSLYVVKDHDSYATRRSRDVGPFPVLTPPEATR